MATSGDPVSGLLHRNDASDKDMTQRLVNLLAARKTTDQTRKILTPPSRDGIHLVTKIIKRRGSRKP